MALQHYQELKVWQKAMDLAELVFTLSDKFPKEQLFGITNQIRRSVISVPSNIAEGSERNSTRDFMRFLSIAKGSIAELETQIILAKRLKYCSDAELEPIINLASEIGKMLNGLSSSLEKKLATDHWPLATGDSKRN